MNNGISNLLFNAFVSVSFEVVLDADSLISDLDAYYLRLDGSNTPTANISFGDFDITNVGNISVDSISSDAGTSIAVNDKFIISLAGTGSTVGLAATVTDNTTGYVGGLEGNAILSGSGGNAVGVWGYLEDNVGSSDAQAGYFYITKNAAGGDSGALYIEEFGGTELADYGLKISGATNGFVKGIEFLGTVTTGIDFTGSTVTTAINAAGYDFVDVGDIAVDSISSADGTSISVLLGTDVEDDFIVGNNNAFVVRGVNDRSGFGTAFPNAIVEIFGTGDLLRVHGASADATLILDAHGNDQDSVIDFQRASISTGIDKIEFNHDGSATNRLLNFYVGQVTPNVTMKGLGLTGINETAPDAMLEIVTNATTEEGLKIKGSASQTGSLFIMTDSSDNRFFDSGDGLANSEVVWNQQGADIDFRVEGVGEANALFVEGATGNIGIGTNDIEDWNAGFTALQMGSDSAIAVGETTNFGFSILQNAYFSDNWRYRTTDEASNIALVEDKIYVRTAPSGTIDEVITWDIPMVVGSAEIDLVSGVLDLDTPIINLQTQATDILLGTFNDSLELKGAIASAGGTMIAVITTGSNHGFGLAMDSTGSGNNNFGFKRSGVNKASMAWDNARNLFGFGNLAYSAVDFSVRANLDGSFSLHDGANGTEVFEVSKDGEVVITNKTAAGVVLTLKGAVSQSASLLNLIDSSSNVYISTGDGLTNSVFSGNVQLADIDFVWAGDTEANLFRVDAGTDTVRMGDWDTNYVSIDKTGDLLFVGSAGLTYGSFWGNDIAFTSSAFGGGGTFVIVSDAGITGGETDNTSFQNNQELLIAANRGGRYKITWSIDAEVAAANKHVEAGIGINGTIQNPGRNHFEAAGANNEYALCGSAILNLAATNTVSVMVTNADGNDQVTVEHVNLSIMQIGG